MSFIMHELVYFGRAIPWIIVAQIPYFKQFKIQNAKMPTAQEQWKCAALVLLSHFTIELPQIWLFHPIAMMFGLDFGVPFPPVLKMAYQIAVFFVLEDAYHYWMHRFLHWGPMYRHVHKMHHTYSAPFGLTAEYASPVEVMMLAQGTVGVPLLWCVVTGDLHILTMYIWIVLRLFQAIDAHSGYDFPWSMRNIFPFWAGSDFHDVHHEKFVGNYSSSFRWWDWMMNTESSALAAEKRRQKLLAREGKKVQ